MERIVLLLACLFLFNTAYAKDQRLTGIIKDKIASAEITYDEKPKKYLALDLLAPKTMVVYSEDVDTDRVFKNVRSVQISSNNNLDKILKMKNKKVEVLIDDECYNSVSPHIYEDIMCFIKDLKLIK